MSYITVRNIDEQLATMIKKKSIELGQSQNTFILKILQSYFMSPKQVKKRDLSKIATWSNKELKEFEKNIESTQKIDPELWGKK